MRAARSARRIYERHPNLGPILYVTSVQYFVVQILAAARFVPAYSWSGNTISDLGNTRCRAFNNRPICSPLHPLMNISFVVLGVTIIAGSMLVYHRFSGRRAVAIGFGAFTVGGLGVVLVGLFPENTIPAFHGIGATLPFLVGNAGIAVLGFSFDVPGPLRVFTWLTGCCALAALILYSSSHYLGLGEGGMERVVAYPQTVWMIVLGIYCLTHARAANRDPGSRTLSVGTSS
jgi:hypothetical membrane protein